MVQRGSLIRTHATDPIMASGLAPRTTGRTIDELLGAAENADYRVTDGTSQRTARLAQPPLITVERNSRKCLPQLFTQALAGLILFV